MAEKIVVLPPCLSDVVESREIEKTTGIAPIIRRCRVNCQHFETADARAGSDPEAVKALETDYVNGGLMNCLNRQE